MNNFEEKQDRYKIAYNNGLTENLLHSFGFWEVMDKDVFDLTIEQRNAVYDAAGYMRGIISHIFQPHQYLDIEKVMGALSAISDILDGFYKDNPDAVIFNSLMPPEGGWERIVRKEKK